ncbi:MarR family winged helix-turn-helix transcriptional regulator [Pelagimonas varians]|uniref:Transcriptional repressor MprA n=1 Tax=Pelagimonas varians TaxID=696760 RepID=A0A238KWE1_9RHOB|nr:MarR family transcriptional regulator [Pelagimonas varians]PYG28339.1 MarR family transcriptional regulator [Pelagimonas varians]SMX46522.1 Transcriptional repressor MprA [Pelagimonas varians]
MPTPDTPTKSVFDIHALEGIYLLYWKMEDCTEAIDIPIPLSKKERHMLVCLDQPRRMGDLARELLALPSTVTAMADTLEAKGLLFRERDPNDRRAWLLSLTEQGHDMRKVMASKASDLFRDISGLSDDELDQFAKIALKIRSRIMETGMPKGPQT